MRFRFPDPNDVAETERRTALLLAIERFWQEFSRAAPDIAAVFSGTSSLDIADFMYRHLNSIDARLMWEYGRAVRGIGHRLVITPESERELRPMVAELLRRAPSLPGWEFYAHRLAEDLEHAIATVKGRVDVDVSNWKVLATIGEHHLVDLKWLLPPGTEGENLQYAAYVASEALLGEEALDTWIGEIGVEALPRPGVLDRLFARGEARAPKDDGPASLAARVHSLIADLDRDLAAQPQSSIDHENGVEYTLFSLEPKQREDYAGRLDLFTSLTSLAPMWRAAHSDFLFCSRRFSKHGETFCYLKMDGQDSADHRDVDARTKLENALNEVLRPGGLGAVIGGGTGLRYTYIDLALQHLDHGLAEMRHVLQQLAVPERSWFLFFDAHLAGEWLGIYDATPPPATGDADEE